MNPLSYGWLRRICLAMTASLVLLAGCQQEVAFAPKPETHPEPVYCFDSVGHKPGARPLIMGGTCCCTPTAALLAQYQADGFLTDKTLPDLLRMYEDRGIKTARDHRECNNLCTWGPHVVKGGKCMVPPTPGTTNYEDIRYGVRFVPVKK